MSSFGRGFGDACNGAASFGMRPFFVFSGFKPFQEISYGRMRQQNRSKAVWRVVRAAIFFPGYFNASKALL
jgi:hypothetical protein